MGRQVRGRKEMAACSTSWSAGKDDNFEETVSKINELIPTIQNSKLIPKFELLKAYATGKYKNKEAFKIALDFVVVSHGGTEEGKRAKEILKQLDK